MEMLIPIAFFGFVAFIVKMSLDYKKWKVQQVRGGSEADNSLRTSELKALIREAVEEANAPLVDRVEAVEAHLDRLSEHRLMPAREASLLDASLDAYEAETVSAARQRLASS